MHGSSLLALSSAIALFTAIPGPGVMSVVSCALGQGFVAAAVLVAGLVLGNLAYLLFALFGLDLITHAFGQLFLALRIGGAAYLIWMGVSLWRAAITPPILDADAQRGSMLRTLLSGVAVSLGNPKVIAFYLGLLPTLISLKGLAGSGTEAIVAVTALVVGGILLTYARLAAAARRLLASPRRIRMLNRFAGTVMVGSSVALVIR
jgi:threonine/homoserine/homoserine lactone efflux protein